MAAVKASSYQHHAGAGTSNIEFGGPGYISPISYNNNTPRFASSVGSQRKFAPLTSTKSLGDESRAGASRTSSKSNRSHSSRTLLRKIDTDMESYTSTSTITAATSPRSDSRNGKLHKRASSGSSVVGPPSPYAGAHSQFSTPFATYEEPFPDISSTPPPTSTPKIKPYLRKMSSTKEDPNQGRLDLSKSVSENETLAGLGIQDFGSRSASDVNFQHTGRRTPHARTTSVGSQVSTGSGSFRPNQPFVHPMRQTPNVPCTPPAGQSYASSLNDDEARESSDIVTDDDLQVAQNIRGRRSISTSSTPQINPTPLSQIHTAPDLGYVPKHPNLSATNLSVKSGRSAKSSKSKLGRSQRATEAEVLPSPSSRNSLDKAFSFVSRRSETDPQNRDERIRAARRKFEEKEANKDRKMEKEALKRRTTEESRSQKDNERQSRKSEGSERTKPSRSHGTKDSEKDSTVLSSKSYDNLRPAQLTALPRHGYAAGSGEDTRRRDEPRSRSPQGSWPRFSTWVQTRVLSCGGKD